MLLMRVRRKSARGFVGRATIAHTYLHCFEGTAMDKKVCVWLLVPLLASVALLGARFFSHVGL